MSQADTMLEMFEKAVVINLVTRQDRKRETQSEFRRIRFGGAQFVPAIRPDGAGPFASVGEHGAYLSHHQVLREARGAASVLIMEDDVQFPPDFAERARLLPALPASWDVLYLGHTQMDSVRRPFAGNGLVRVGSEYEFICLHCYAVNGKAIPRLVDAYDGFLLRPKGDPEGGPMPVDGALNVARRQLDLETYASVPPLANQRSSRTDIGRQRWFDKLPLLDGPINWMRRAKNSLTR